MSKPLGQHFPIPEHVIVTTSYSFTSVHDSSDIYCELFKLATIEYHSDLYLDYIGVGVRGLGGGSAQLHTKSFNKDDRKT